MLFARILDGVAALVNVVCARKQGQDQVDAALEHPTTVDMLKNHLFQLFYRTRHVRDSALMANVETQAQSGVA
jgi:hypothetical protein